MKPFRDPLDRLLKAAAQAPPRAVGEPPLRTTARALAYWRAPQAEEAGFALLALFRRGVALAGALAAVTVVLSLWEMRHSTTDIWDVSDAVINVASLR